MIKSPLRPTIALIMSLGVIVTPAMAASHIITQHDAKNPNVMNHETMNPDQVEAMSPTDMVPTEPGQGAFATIAEIVVLLKNDPATDWNKVDINALREHLVDMDEVTLRSNAQTQIYDDRIVFNVSGVGRSQSAIQAMVPAHAGVLERVLGWNVSGELNDNGATLTIFSQDSNQLKFLKALGFYGVMATGAHHQPHHLAMAKGDMSVHANN